MAATARKRPGYSAPTRFAMANIQTDRGRKRVKGGLSYSAGRRYGLSRGSPHLACWTPTPPARVTRRLMELGQSQPASGAECCATASIHPTLMPPSLRNRHSCKALTTCADTFHVKHRHSWSRAQASRAIARQAVRPGDSIPKRLSRPGTPWTAGPSSRKSPDGAPGPTRLGLIPA